MSSCSAWRWVTSAMGPPSATAALSALTLFSRPTWSGTIISGKMTVSRRATSGSSRGPWSGSVGLLVDRGGRSLGHRGSPDVRCDVGVGGRSRCRGRRSVDGRGVGRWRSRSASASRPALGGVAGALGVEGFEDPRAEALLELEQDAGRRRGSRRAPGSGGGSRGSAGCRSRCRGGCWSASGPGRAGPRPRRSAGFGVMPRRRPACETHVGPAPRPPPPAPPCSPGSRSAKRPGARTRRTVARSGRPCRRRPP